VEQLDGCAGVHNGQEDEEAHARHMQRREHVDYDKMVHDIQRKVAATRHAHPATADHEHHGEKNTKKTNLIGPDAATT
jgi:hypothetical protein